MTDLTAITTPFGLLDPETRAALKEAAKTLPIEEWNMGRWQPSGPVWLSWHAYRVKTAPPKPREWWLTDNGCYWHSFEEAKGAYGDPDDQIIHVREVLE